MPQKPYSALSDIYERVMKNNDYDKWADYIVNLVKQNSNGNVGLDLACGSGYFTRALYRNGFSVEGVDVSSDMLNEAVKISRKEGLNILFRQGDMSTVKTLKKVDFVTIVNDGINYISPDNLLKTFKRIYSLLNKSGVLIFDISSEYKLKNVIANNVFAEDDEDETYVWFNKLYDDRVEMDISVFTKDGDRYVKKEEEQTQYIHTLSAIKELLQTAGYKSVTATNHMGGQVASDSLRIQFIAKKQ